MKIAMIGSKGIPAKSGGVEKHVEEISKALVQNGHEVTVYCRNTYINNDVSEYEGAKLKVIKTIPNKNLDAIVYTYKATMDALKGDFDVFHYHAIGPASLSIIPALLGKKVVVTVHGLDWQRGKWGKLAKLYLKFGEYITGKSSNKIISVSSNLRNYFIEKYKRDKKNVFFVPNGVNIYSKQQPNEIKKYDLDANNYILFLARLVPEKGAHYLIEAYNRIKTDKKLVISGGTSFTDDYINKLKKLANNNPNIIFTGNVSGNMLRELYSNCYLYVLPSDIEGMPLTLLEAMSYGKWCLVSDIPENKSVILNGVYGDQFLKSDVESLSYELDKVLNNKELGKNSKDIIEYVNKEFNWETVAKKTLEVY